MRIYIVVTAHWELWKGSSTPSSNCDVCTRASAAFALPVPVLFAFASRCFLRCSFASITIISRVCCDSNFLICFLLRVEDHVEVSVVIGTWIEVLVLKGWEDGITSSSLLASLLLLVLFSETWVIGGSKSSSLDEVASWSLILEGPSISISLISSISQGKPKASILLSASSIFISSSVSLWRTIYS